VSESYARPGTKPTPRELEVAAAVLVSDSIPAAAARLRMDPRSVRRQLANLRIRLRARNNEQLFFRLHDHLAA
jgi:DNA-binding CsgD family transcriptional regulator